MMNADAISQLRQFGNQVPSWIEGLREPAQNRFLATGLPQRQDEDWQYTNLKPLQGLPFNWSHARGMIHGASVRQHFAGACHTVVFVDGVWDSSLSSIHAVESQPGVIVKSLTQALKDHEQDVKAVLTKRPSPTQAFTNLNDAFLYSGLYLAFAEGVVVKEPIHLVFVNTAKPQAFCSFPRIVVAAGKGSEATILSSFVHHEDGQYLASHQFHFDLEPSAQIKHLVWQKDAPQGYHLSHYLVHCQRDASFEGFQIAAAGKLSRHETEIYLNEPGAHIELNGLYLSQNQQQSDIYTTIHHLAPHCSSHQFYKGMIKDGGRGVFSGRINVAKDAQQTNSRQLNRNLLLGDLAEINTKPQLMIDADDVKCSHGATIGRLATDDLFYLQSRGIPRKEAETILTKAFAAELIGKMPFSGFRRLWQDHLDRWLHG